MKRNYVLSISIIVVLGAGIFFTLRLQRAKTIVLTNTSSSSENQPVVEQTPETSPSTSLTPTPATVPIATSTPTPTPTPASSTITIPTKIPSPKTADISSDMKIRTKLVDFGFSVPSKPRSIDTIVLHSSYDSLGDDPYSIEGIIDIYKSYGVSAHYLIARDGTIYRLVKDENIAYHAGVSKVPDGRTNVNDFSIGIEIVNTKTSDYTSEQYASVKRLIASLKDKYVIKYVLGHDAIAPGRKTDPWNFAWKQL